MRGSPQQESDGLPMALAIHLSVYCVVAACFALAMYYLMQPIRLPNPGMAAHKASARTVSYLELLRSEREAGKHDVRIAAEPETTGAGTPQAREVKPETNKAKAQSMGERRQRPARPAPSQDTAHYAQQPSFDAYRPMY
jgi:hypothetical protein